LVKRISLWLAGMLLCAAGLSPAPVRANSSEGGVKAETKADFAAVMAAVKKEMVPGGRYEFVDNSERKTIDTNLARMQSLFGKFETVAAMDKDAKFQLYVNQENVNAILTHRDDRRMICKSERPMGSLISKRICRTYGAIERDRQNSQEEMIRSARPGWMSNGANPSATNGRIVFGSGQH